MDILQTLFNDAQTAKQHVLLARGKHLAWLEEQLKMPRQQPEGYERLRLDISIREVGLRMLNEDHEEQYTRYMQAQHASGEKWRKIFVGINIALAILMFGATLAMAIATVGIWRTTPSAQTKMLCP